MLTFLNKIPGVFNTNKTNITFEGLLQGDNNIADISRLVFIFNGIPYSTLSIGNPNGVSLIRTSFYNEDSNESTNFLHNFGSGFKCGGLILEFEDCSNYHIETANETWEHHVITKAIPNFPYPNDKEDGYEYNFIQVNSKSGSYPKMYDKNVKVIIPWYTPFEDLEQEGVEMLIFYE